ncbi:MAG: hypothetical protein LBG73_11345 [Spirochaetaceae bacterium]|jgi:hypothetical protein|nr:hypothetical protein [Spirochaetaceae bacterium]
MYKKAWTFFFIIMFTAAFLSAQEDEYPPEEPDQETPIQPNWSDYTPFAFSRGDQMLSVSVVAAFPTVFAGSSGVIDHNLFVVGMGISLGYSYFLTPGFFVGGEIGGIATTSIAKNWLYIAPFGVKAGYQFTFHHTRLPGILRNFEFPVSLMVGGALQSYLNNDQNYLGFFLKPGVGAFFRFHQSWSVGINAEWWWVPQWTDDTSKDIHGHFFECTLTARYHF